MMRKNTKQEALDLLKSLRQSINLNDVDQGVLEEIQKVDSFLKENEPKVRKPRKVKSVDTSVPIQDVPGLFRVIDDTTDTYPLGGDVAYANPYVSSYAKVVSGKMVRDLEVGESCVAEYNVSGTGPTTYRILRVE